MSAEYDLITAKHYAAYRPELHKIILDKCLTHHNFEFGIDIGCGTGSSTIALANYCIKVIGVDPSLNMIKNAQPHSKANYYYFNGKNFDFNSDLFDIVTLAGSLFYAKSQTLLDEIVRISKNNSLIIVYDFNILLDDILQHFGFKTPATEPYNHETDFSGLQENTISLLKSKKETITITIEPNNLAHLLLSVKSQYHFFKELWQQKNPHQKLSNLLKNLSTNGHFNSNAKLFYKVYRVLK